MAKSELIAPSPSTPTALLRSAGSRRAIPDDLLQEASLRLGIMSVLGAVLWTVGTVAGHFADRATNPEALSWARFEGTDVIALVMVIVSLGLFAFTRRSKLDPCIILDIGLGYLVDSAFAPGVIL